jgi:opacity protein-like surface antigen
MSRSALGVAGLLLLLSTVARAQEGYSREGIYAVASGSYAFAIFKDQFEEGFKVQVNPDNSLGFDLRAGYRLHPHVAMELELEWLDGFELDLAGATQSEIETLGLSYNFKPYFMTGKVQPYLLVGVGILRAKFKVNPVPSISQRQTDFAARFGGGVDAYVTENVALNLGVTYVLPSGQLSEIDHVSLAWGVMYRF